MSGIVFLVGAGPGDPGLLTLKGAECLRRADVLIYDYLANDTLLADVPADCERIYVGKQAGDHALPQEEINQLLIDKARECGVVVRLKGGDPFIFGRGGEEAEELHQAGIRFEVVPGVTAGAAGAAYAGIPLTHRGVNSTVTLITGHERADAEEDGIPWSGLAQLRGTLVFYMGVGALSVIVKRLTGAGLAPSTPAALIEWATYPRQRTVTGELANIAAVAKEAKIKPPAIIVIGEVVGLGETLNWFERKPLFGKRIAVTRSRAQASSLTRRLIELGAEALELPTIKLAPPDDVEPLHRAAREVGGYDWVIFTSVNGVEHFFSALSAQGLDVRQFGIPTPQGSGPRLAAIGPATRDALELRGLRVEATPQRYVAEDLLDSLKSFGDLKGSRLLLPRADVARDALPDGLRAAGAEVDVVAAYQTLQERPDDFAELATELAAGAIDAVTFTSSSTARNLAELLGRENFQQLKSKCVLASIGPITSETLRELGLEPTVEAEEYTIPGLIEALGRHWGVPPGQI